MFSNLTREGERVEEDVNVIEVIEVIEAGSRGVTWITSTTSTSSTTFRPMLPFAVPPIRFPFRALAARVGRAPLGGEREVAMAALMVARLACDAIGPSAADVKQREERATAAKSWLAAIAVPARARPALLRALDATARDSAAVAAAIDEVVKVTAAWLDEPSLAELRAVATAPLVNSR